MSRGTREVARLIKAMGGSELSAYGLCHLGDYEATVFSPYSHNRQFGESFVRGQDYHQLAEGYYTVKALMLLGQRYPMDWQVRQDAPQDETIRAELLALGMPQNVLDDLTAEEVAGLTGASEVLTQTDTRYDSDKYRVVTTGIWDEDTPNTWQYQSAEKQGDGTYRYTYHVYDVEEVCTMIHVAVVLPRDGYQRVVFLHHIAARPEGLALTESVEVWPMWRDDENWTRGNIIGGRVLCGRRGQTYTADFAAPELLRKQPAQHHHCGVVAPAGRGGPAGLRAVRRGDADAGVGVSGELVQLRAVRRRGVSVPQCAGPVAQLGAGR